MENSEESIFINLHSSDGISISDDGYLSNLTFNFTNIIHEINEHTDIKVCIDNCQIPFSFYNINSTNNILKYSINDIIYYITIITGNYTEYTLINQIMALFLVNGHTFSIQFSKITGKINITGPSIFIFYPSSLSILSILGFRNNSFYTSSSLFNLVSEFPVNIIGTKKLKICSDKLSLNNIDSKSKNRNILQFIPVNVPPYSLILFNNNTDKSSTVNISSLNEIDIKILDDFGNYVNFNNCHWSITLAITIQKQKTKKDLINTFQSITKQKGYNDDDLQNDDIQMMLYRNGIFL